MTPPAILKLVSVLALLVLGAGCATAPPFNRVAKATLPQNFEFFATYDVPPRLRDAPPTQYPPFMLAQGVRGSVTIDFLISVQGTVSRATVERASHEAFGATALSTVNRMQFDPATRQGRPVPVAARVSFVFDYEDQPVVGP